MKRRGKKKAFRLPRWIAALALAAGASRAGAQSVDWGPSQSSPGLSYLIPRLKYIEMDMEYEADSFNSPGTDLQTVRWYLAPDAGIEWDNYIYHPDLLTYTLLFEPGYIWQRTGSPGDMSTSQELALEGALKADLLSAKPYMTVLNYDRSREEVDYDFFNSAIVNTEDYGATSGYRDGPVPVLATFERTDVNSSEPGQDSDTVQTTVNLNAKNERADDDLTELNYQFGDFNRVTSIPGLSYTDDDTYSHLTLVDMEHYQKSTLRSSLLFDDIESANSFSSSDLNATVDYEIQHTPHLNSGYNYSFSRYADSVSDYIQNTATATLRHQLFDSLTSTLEVQGSTENSSASGSTLDTYSGQITWSENYTKRLGGWGRLTLGENASYTFTAQEANGSQTVIANEAHVVPNTGLIILDQPLDIAISTITDSSGTIILQPGLDYTVNEATDPWQIQINSGGPNHITPGSTILVTYTVRTNPSGNYSVFANQAQIRLGFWHNKADVYALYDITANQASSPEFLLQNQNEFQAGADVSWRQFSVHGDYTDNISTLYDSQMYDLAESFTLMTTAHSRLGANFGQQWDFYSFNTATTGSPNQHSTFFNFMLTCEWHPTSNLSWNNEAGWQRTYGSQINQDLVAARSYLNWHVGKLEVHLGYEYDSQDYPGQSMKRNFAFVRIRRNF